MKFRGPKPKKKVDLDTLQTQVFYDEMGNLYCIEQWGMDRSSYTITLVEANNKPKIPYGSDPIFERSELKEIFGIE